MVDEWGGREDWLLCVVEKGPACLLYVGRTGESGGLVGANLPLLAGSTLTHHVFPLVLAPPPGKYVDLKDTMSGFKGVLEGKYDDLPEMAFYMVGDINEVRWPARSAVLCALCCAVFPSSSANKLARTRVGTSFWGGMLHGRLRRRPGAGGCCCVGGAVSGGGTAACMGSWRQLACGKLAGGGCPSWLLHCSWLELGQWLCNLGGWNGGQLD